MCASSSGSRERNQRNQNPLECLSMVSASLNSAMAAAGEMRRVASWRMMSPSDRGILLRITAFLPTGRSSQASDEVIESTPAHSLFYRKTGGAMTSICISETWEPTATGCVCCHWAELKPCFRVWSGLEQSRMLSISANPQLRQVWLHKVVQLGAPGWGSGNRRYL